MKNPLLNLLPLLALTFYPLERVSAIAISIGSSFGQSSAGSAGNPIGDFDQSFGPGPAVQVALTTSPLNSNITLAASSWSFVNTPTQAIWNGAQSLNNFGAVSPFSSGAGAYGELRFLLSETVNYSVTNSFMAGLNDGATARSFARLAKRGEPDFQFNTVYSEIDLTTGIFGFNQFGDGVGPLIGTNTGILKPGGYLFIFGAEISNGNGGTGNGTFTFTLTRSVPDAGSTLTLLGMALCAIGGIARKLNLA